MEKWVEALAKQLRYWSQELARPTLDTVFLGGGTPSLLENDLLERTGRLIQENFALGAGCEFTVECNPETLDRAKLASLNAMGANRLSLGIQSFQDNFLERLERHARSGDNERALDLVASHWSGRWSLDLMFGLPGQSSEQWKSDLMRALQYEPKHISAYQLTLTTSRSKSWKQPPEDELLKLFDESEAWLADAGLEHYEVSNFARPGFESRHNLRYWRLEPFLGLGPGAAGLLSASRLSHVTNANFTRFGAHQRQPERFEVWAKQAGQGEFETKQLESRSSADHLAEMMMMGFRLREGLPAARFGSLERLLPKLWAQEQELEFITLKQGHWVPTPKGLRILDSLLPRLLAKLEKDAGRELDLNGIDPTFQ
jgi:oxygen-independent coproporphyrinogen-3 oxidase